MNFREYIKLSERTDAKLGDNDQLHWLLGCYNEFGEMIGVVKKSVAKQQEIDKTKLQDECADVCWYIAKGCRVTGFSPPDTYAYVEQDNILNLIAIFNEAWNKRDIMGMLCVMMNISSLYGTDFNKGLENNIEKLNIRHPNGFDKDAKKHTKEEQQAIAK